MSGKLGCVCVTCRIAYTLREQDKLRQDDLAIFAQLNFQLLALRVSIFVPFPPPSFFPPFAE